MLLIRLEYNTGLLENVVISLNSFANSKHTIVKLSWKKREREGDVNYSCTKQKVAFHPIRSGICEEF